MMKSFRGEFDGIQAWLKPAAEQQQPTRHFVPLTEGFVANHYRTVSLTEADLKSPNLYQKLNEATKQQSSPTPTDPRFLNSWEQSFYQERQERIGAALRAEEEALEAARSLGLNSIAEARDLQTEANLGSLKAELAELTATLNRLLLKESSSQAQEPEEEPELEPGEQELEEEPEQQPGGQEQGSLDFNVSQRFSQIENAEMLATELVQLIADMGKQIPQVKPIADQLLELL